MFRAPLCRSSGAHDDSVGYHIGRLVLGLLLIGGLSAGRADECQSGHSSALPALNFQPAATLEPDDLCGNQHYRRELLMTGIMVPENLLSLT